MAKIFVLDTSVLLFDHHSITSFQENDIIIPITVLEELDNFKEGGDSLSYSAREVARFIDKLSADGNVNKWLKLGEGKGRLRIELPPVKAMEVDAEQIFGKGKNDHKILNTALGVKKKHKSKKVVLVTKDINLRIKAKALSLEAEDYLNGKVAINEQMTNGFPSLDNLDASIIKDIYQKRAIAEDGILAEKKVANGYYILNNCTQSVLVRYNGENEKLERVEKEYAFGIKPKNVEQTFAMNALLNNDIKLVALQGVAGTGKTLLALAAALEQKSLYDSIILSRPIVPLSNRDIGFLPGDAEDKISPYMQPLWDNLKFIKYQHKDNSRKGRMIEELSADGTIEITALTFIRGRSLVNSYFIVDEAQNLTPHEIKTIITRAGEGTKIVFTGDVNQIDTPYLDTESNGLTYVINRLKGDPLFAHIKLEKGERSQLANLANRLL